MAELRRYLRDNRNQVIGIIVATARNEVGGAFVHKGDRFNKELGLEIARGRAMRGSKATIPHYAQEEFNKMIERSQKYFR